MTSLSRSVYAIAAVALAAIIFVAGNIAVDATFTTSQIDLTENGVYTVSKGTREILRGLREPVTLKFYYSKRTAAGYAQVAAYASRVRDLLQHYAAIADGKLIVEEIDPEPYTKAEDQATAAGLTGAQTDSGDLVYLGLTGSNTIDGEESIPFLSLKREPYLEYDVTSMIYRLAEPKKPVVGILSALPLETGAGGMMAMMQGRSRPYAAYQSLQQAYQTKTIAADFTALPDNLNVLLIVQPGKLNDAQLYAIDQFVLRGGHALIFVDPQSEVAEQSAGEGGPAAPSASNLPALFKAWGIGFDPSKIIADGRLAQQVQVQDDPRNPVALIPTWLRIGKAQFDTKDQVTASLTNLNLATAGALSPLKGATTSFTPLITSSGEASLLESTTVRLTQRPQDLLDQIHPDGTHYTIAARISGRAGTAFPNGPPPGAPAAGQIKAAKTINLIVMADTDIFDDRFWVRGEPGDSKGTLQAFADNGAFILNAVENLTGSDALISLRTRPAANRPFTVVQELQAKAQAQFQREAEALQSRLSDTEARLKALQQGDTQSGGSAALTPAQLEEVDRFKHELIETRLQLRDVQHNLRAEVDQLGSILAFLNIALVPMLVAAFAVGLAAWRRRQRARAL